MCTPCGTVGGGQEDGVGKLQRATRKRPVGDAGVEMQRAMRKRPVGDAGIEMQRATRKRPVGDADVPPSVSGTPVGALKKPVCKRRND